MYLWGLTQNFDGSILSQALRKASSDRFITGGIQLPRIYRSMCLAHP